MPIQLKITLQNKGQFLLTHDSYKIFAVNAFINVFISTGNL